MSVNSNMTQKPKRTNGGITWDEETIAQHDLERGTRMKIDEPSTPFRRVEVDDDDFDDDFDVASETNDTNDTYKTYETNINKTSSSSSHSRHLHTVPVKEQWDKFHSKLEAEKVNLERNRQSSEQNNSWEENDDKETFSREDFVEHRKAHYSNEFERVKAWRQMNTDDME